MLLKSLLLRNTLHIFEIECKVIKKKLNYQTFPIIFYICPVKTGKKAHIFFFLYDCKITLRLSHRLFTSYHNLPVYLHFQDKTQVFPCFYARVHYLLYRVSASSEVIEVRKSGRQKKKTECITTLGLQQIREL